MRLSVPRGIVYHRVFFDLVALAKAAFVKLDDKNLIARFEDAFARYMGTRYCLAFPFARTSIYHCLKAQNFAAGCEIIMPPISIKPILDVVLDVGLKPVFVDLDPETLCFDVEKLKAAIGPNTRAVLITYLFGIVPDLGKIMEACRSKNLFVIEDFSHCLNGRFGDRKVGTFGHVGVYSSSSIKTFDIYGGGLLITNEQGLYNELRRQKEGLAGPNRIALLKKIWVDLLRNVATSRIMFHFLVFPLLRFATRLNPERSIKHVGTRDTQMIDKLPKDWFTQFTSFQASIGFRLLPTVELTDMERIKNVEQIKSLANNQISRFPKGAPNTRNVYWQLMAYFDSPFKTQRFFQEKKIDTSTTSLVYISNLSAYPYRGDTPVAGRLHSNGLFIPAYPGLRHRDLRHIADALSATPGDNSI